MDIPRRKEIRLPGYDYSQAGFYFLTICTQHRLCLFGKILAGDLVHNDAGKMIQRWWKKLEQKFPEIILHDSVVMPNHVHGIIQIQRSKEESREEAPSVATMIQWFKTMSMNEYIQGVKQQEWRPFSKRLWQRNYYEHIIRDEDSYHEIVEYIRSNPQNWGKDKYYM
ncbi:transposase [Gimesia sp.]|uniref:transposase n=1 Tax=Gimesia sp. TaxID=2024833 RepID=UPI003A92C1FF